MADESIFLRKKTPAPPVFPVKVILKFLAVLLGLALLAALGLFVYFKLQFTTYADSQYKFSIKYPKSWKVVVHPQPNVAVVFLRPKDTAMDTIQENFSVTVQPIPASIFNLAQFSATVKNQMTAVFSKSIQIAEDKPLHWGWREGRQMVFNAPKPDHLKMVNAWVLRDNQSYILTFFGDMNKYDKDKFYIEEIIHSLQLE